MKITTWNINHRNNPYELNHILSVLNSDIACFQECFHPLTYMDQRDFNNLSGHYIWEPTINGWENCIYSKDYPITQISIDNPFKGRILLGEITNADNNKLQIANLHVPVTKGYSRHNLRQSFDKLGDFISKGKTIVCGDFNFGVCFDHNGRTDHGCLACCRLVMRSCRTCHFRAFPLLYSKSNKGLPE
jgi:exonuclease III